MTMNKRDLLLQEMGITQWQLRHPERLKGAAKIVISEQVKVVMLCDEAIKIQQPLLQDILRSMQLENSQFLSLTFAQLQHLHSEHSVIYWLLSDDLTLLNKFAEKCSKAAHIWRSPSWHNLLHSPQAKRQLWQQMQQQ